MYRIKKALNNVKISLLDDAKRIRLQFIWIYCILTAVSLFMTVVNIITGKRLLMAATLVFSIMCFINMLLAKHSEKALRVSGWIFSVELIALLTFFIVSGSPEGFSSIWICLLPAGGLLLFRRKRGTALCAVMFVILVFFFETQFGNSLLQYQYTDSFKLRFPMLYLAFYAVSFLFETIRSLTFDEMKKAQSKYEYLYRHDALTEVYNRYGFNERMDALLSSRDKNSVALLILDMDHFKKINDMYGHQFGDEVLKKVAALLTEQAGPGADVCRWGGEEFAILLSGEQDAVQCGGDILKAVRGTTVKTKNGGEVSITVSIGIAVASPYDDTDPATLVRTADACLYMAKESGRDNMVCRRMQSDNECP